MAGEQEGTESWESWRKTPFFCQKVPFGPIGMAPPVAAGTEGLTQQMDSGKDLWWWQAGRAGGKEKTIKCKNQVFYISALMVVVSHGHAEEPLYSFPRSSSVVPFTMWLIITGRVCIISVMMYR